MQAKKMADPVAEMFIWSKLGEKLLEMEVRRFARIKKVVWDQLLAIKKLSGVSRIFVLHAFSKYRYAVKVSDYILCRA